MKEMFRADFEERRQEFETNNLGSYDLLYPCKQENPKLHDEYDALLAYSNKLFDDVQAKKYSRKHTEKTNKDGKPTSGGWSWGAPKAGASA